MSANVTMLRSLADSALDGSAYEQTCKQQLRAAADEIERLRADNATLRNLHLTREAERADLQRQLVSAKDVIRGFVEAYKHQDCDNINDEMARAYSVADAHLSLSDEQEC